MSYEAIRFCSYCNLKSEELEKLDPPKVLKTCTICKIVQYCDRKCQRQDYVARHKRLCVDLFKPTKDRAADAYAMLRAKGFDPYTKETSMKFFEDNEDLYNSVFSIGKCDHSIGVLFSVYNHSKSMGTRFLGEIARKHQSYHGTQIALDAYLENMLNLQPTAFHLRMFIPLFMIQLGDDDRAYNFIKFWVKITPFQEFVTHEARLFNNLPFTQVTMKDQDKKENFFKALGIGMEDTPYFPHLIFYVCLAIIKKNNFDATKDRKQNQDFIQLMEYIKLHYQDFLKIILSPPYNAQVRSGERPKFDIPYRFGLFRGKEAEAEEHTASFAQEMMNNFVDDLNFYLERAPEMRRELLMYF